MPWHFYPYKFSSVENLVLKVMQQGTLPKHLALILDGNRRYSRKYNETMEVSYEKGFYRFNYFISLCLQLGISNLSGYLFSIENFKRSKKEVDFLLDTFTEFFINVNADMSFYHSNEIRLVMSCELYLLPERLQQEIVSAVKKTAHYRRLTVHFQIAYTSRQEISTGIAEIKNAVDNGIINLNDINESTLANSLYSQGIPDPDILIRTSGEIRLSDYMIWQLGSAYIAYIPQLWPELNIWHFFKVLVNYQLQANSIRRTKQCNLSNVDTSLSAFSKFNVQSDENNERFVKYVLDKRISSLNYYDI